MKPQERVPVSAGVGFCGYASVLFSQLQKEPRL